WAQPSTPAEAPHPMEARPGRTETFPREVREAYAVLELPLGADRSRIDQAFKALVQRYHPDHHAGQPELQRTAAELTIRLTDARELLYSWLEGRR
ncbi:MAG TPA: J domain-containing protein, partial [Myxococcota bacterium]|nr:J domain-containing protein [Myxococcota bacterium]